MVADISTDLLKAFIAVADRRSFTRAAYRLRRTQAAVSMQVKRLEQITEARLFERGARSVTLTAEGERLLGYAHRIIALNEEALEAMAERRLAGTVRLGVPEDYAVGVLPPILQDFLSAHSKVAVEVETALTGRLLQHLGRTFDLILAMHPGIATPGEVIRHEQAVWVGPRDRDIHQSSPLPLALGPQGCLFRHWALAALDRLGRPWRLAYVSPSEGAMNAAVASGFAVSVLKASTCPVALRVLGPRDGLPPLPEAYMALHRAPDLSRQGRALAAHLVEALRGASDNVIEATAIEPARAACS